MTNLTKNGIENYLTKTYGDCRHDANAMKIACSKLAKEMKVKAIDVFFYIIERRDIAGRHLTSYGFDTAEGRAVRTEFESYYYEAR